MQLSPRLTLVAAFVLAPSLCAQVHYNPDGSPWNQHADGGPDAAVDGWYYNLGVTGLRVRLIEDRPTCLRVMYVFPDSPASGKIEVGDLLTGAGGAAFATAHQNGYGMDKFGPKGPILDFAIALEACQGDTPKLKAKGKGDGDCAKEPTRDEDQAAAPPESAAFAVLPEATFAPGYLGITFERAGKTKLVTLRIPRKYGSFAPSFPYDCKKTELILSELYEYLVDAQHDDGSWGGEVQDTFAPLALLASGNKRYLPAVQKSVRFHAKNTKAKDQASLINWRYMSAAIVISEYSLSITDKQENKGLRNELQEVYDFLLSSQYTDLAQVSPRVKETHPDALPHTALASHGGWGHNPGFEGYGPIAMLTAQGAIAFALMQRVGIEVDPERHQAAYAFLTRGTGKTGYTWYGDQAASETDYADMGRTGASALAHYLSQNETHQALAKTQAHLIALHPEPFPDTHGSPLMGMAYAALGANTDGTGPFQALLQANQWWFTLAQTQEGNFYYQPNRDNAGYGSDSRLEASAVVAFVLSIPKGNLVITGKRRAE